MIEFQEHAEGTILRVKVRPGASRNRLEGEHGGALKVSVSAAPEKNRANRALAELLASVFGLKRSQVVLTFGAKSREKTFLLHGLSVRDARRLLDSALSG